MNSSSSLSRRDAARPSAPLAHAPAVATTQERRPVAAAQGYANASRSSAPSSGLLCGLPRPSFGKAPAPLHNGAWPATGDQRAALATGFHEDRTVGATAERHDDTQMSGQFARDAVRSSIFLVEAGQSWSTSENISPARPSDLPDTAHKLINFCDKDHEWAFRVSQFANQNLANRALLAGLIGGQGLDGRVYKRRKILNCETLQNDTVSPQHERLELHRVNDNTLRLVWNRARDVSGLRLAGRQKLKQLGKGASYAVTVAVDIDRPQTGETAPVRLHDATLRVSLPRPLDA